MTRSEWTAILGAASACVVLGGGLGVASVLDGAPISAVEAPSTWTDPKPAVDLSRSERRFQLELLRSGVFGRGILDISEQRAEKETPEQGPRTAFPQILSSAVLDGEPQVIVKDGETVMTVGVGEQVGDGWTIVAVALNTVTAQQGDDQQDFPILSGGSTSDASGRANTNSGPFAGVRGRPR